MLAGAITGSAHLTLGSLLSWNITPLSSQRQYVYDKSEQSSYINGSRSYTDSVDFLYIRVQTVEIIKSQLVYPLISIRATSTLPDTKQSSWVEYPKVIYQNYDEPYLILPLQHYKKFLIKIQWNPNAFLDSNSYEILVYNPTDTKILQDSDIFINIKNVVPAIKPKTFAAAKIMSTASQLAGKKSYQNKLDTRFLVGKTILIEIMVCQNIPDDFALNSVTIFGDALFFDDASNNIVRSEKLFDLNRELEDSNYAVFMVSPNVGVQYLSLSYSVENNSETTFRVHTTIFNSREQAEKYFQLKSEQFNVNIVDVFKENFGYDYPDFEGIGNWHFYANFVYSANEAEFNYRSMCGFSDNTFYFYDDFFNKKKLALGKKTNLTKSIPLVEIISADTSLEKPPNSPTAAAGDTGTNTIKTKLSKSNEKECSTNFQSIKNLLSKIGNGF